MRDSWSRRHRNDDEGESKSRSLTDIRKQRGWFRDDKRNKRDSDS